LAVIKLPFLIFSLPGNYLINECSPPKKNGAASICKAIFFISFFGQALSAMLQDFPKN
jgi:hypothetical protein